MSVSNSAASPGSPAASACLRRLTYRSIVSSSALSAASSIALASATTATGAGFAAGVPPSAAILSASICACVSSSGISFAKNVRSSWRYGPCTMLA